MSQAGANSPSGGSGGGITTIDGDVGSVTGSTVTITGGTTGYTFNGSGSTLTLIGSGSSFTWQSITSNQVLVAGHGYFIASGTLQLALPASASIGDTITVSLTTGGTSWSINQAAGQSIRVGNLMTTTGITGSVASTANGDTITIVYYSANVWQATVMLGELLIN